MCTITRTLIIEVYCMKYAVCLRGIKQCKAAVQVHAIRTVKSKHTAIVIKGKVSKDMIKTIMADVFYAFTGCHEDISYFTHYVYDQLNLQVWRMQNTQQEVYKAKVYAF